MSALPLDLPGLVGLGSRLWAMGPEITGTRHSSLALKARSPKMTSPCGLRVLGVLRGRVRVVLDSVPTLNEHSFIFQMPATSSVRRRAVPAPPPVVNKRDAILRAAIDVFAERGYFNAQVADVARAAGVAAGTVYLYFRSKDDLLVSIFERTVRAQLEEGRAAVADVTDPAERLRIFAHLHLSMLGRDRKLAIVFQVELRQSLKFMERFSSTLLRDYLGQIRAAIEQGQQQGLFRAELNPTAVAKMFFGALDEMATNWILSRRRYSLESDADAVVDIFLEGSRAR